MEMRVTPRDPNTRIRSVRTDSTLFYDTLAKTLRESPDMTIEVDPEGRSVPSMRAALRSRGCYVTISAKMDERPWVKIMLEDTDSTVKIRERERDDRTEYITIREMRRRMLEFGMNPDDHGFTEADADREDAEQAAKKGAP